jgi:cytochrome c
MKKIGLTIFTIATLVACGNDPKTTDTASSDAKPEASGPSANPDYAAGFELVAKSDCFQCHKVDDVLVGPSYRDVANKYASQAPGVIPELAGKIIKGSSGVWGPAMMLPHASLSQADAETMVKYILTLKTK